MVASPIVWPAKQQAAISAALNERIRVDAGPGPRKTVTACARVAWLVKLAHLHPSDIRLLSFVSDAVREIPDRIAGYCGGVDQIAGIGIPKTDVRIAISD